MDFPKKLKSLRQEKGISQTELAKAINVSQSAIGYWERGEKKPSVDALTKIAMFFRIPLIELIGYDDIYFNIHHKMSPERFNALENKIALDLFYATQEGKNLNEGKLKKINDLFTSLNDTGQNKAVEQVEMLTKIPEYRKDNDQ